MTPRATDLPALPAPDTHCEDLDTGEELWTYSHNQMREYGAACIAALAAPAEPAFTIDEITGAAVYAEIGDCAFQSLLIGLDEARKSRAATQPSAPQAPAGWFESPHGNFRVNPDFKFSFPSQTLSWQIPLYVAPVAPQQPAAEARDALDAARYRWWRLVLSTANIKAIDAALETLGNPNSQDPPTAEEIDRMMDAGIAALGGEVAP